MAAFNLLKTAATNVLFPLEKLSVRMAIRQKKNAASWAGFVGDITDERLKDPDEILAALEVLNRSPEELQAACELLVERREWAATLKGGDLAESEYPKLQAQAAAAEKALEKMIEDHSQSQWPLGRKIEAARTAISNGADARRRLLETCSPEARQAATTDIDSRIAETQAEQQDVRRLIHDCHRWVLEVDSRGGMAADSDRERLPSQ